MSTRTTIKDAIVAAIKADATIASTRVYKGRRNTVQGTALPAVYVWMGREVAATQSQSIPRTREAMMTLFVDYWQANADPSTLEDAFDTGSDKIQTALQTAGLHQNPRQDVVLTDTEYIYDTVEDQIIGCARLTFTATYIYKET